MFFNWTWPRWTDSSGRLLFPTAVRLRFNVLAWISLPCWFKSLFFYFYIHSSMSIAFRVCVRFKHFGQRSRGYLHGCRSFWGRFHRRSTSLQVQRSKLSLGRPQRLALPTRFQWHVTITQWPFAHSLFVKRIFFCQLIIFFCVCLDSSWSSDCWTAGRFPRPARRRHCDRRFP